MGWRSIVITRPARLEVNLRAIEIRQEQGVARVPLEDVANLVLDHPEVTLTATLLSACAEEGITVVTVDEKHLPNGVLTPFLAHHRTPKMIRAQLALGAPATKRLWQRLVQQKITNQAALLLDAGSTEAGQRLQRMV